MDLLHFFLPSFCKEFGLLAERLPNPPKVVAEIAPLTTLVASQCVFRSLFFALALSDSSSRTCPILTRVSQIRAFSDRWGPPSLRIASYSRASQGTAVPCTSTLALTASRGGPSCEFIRSTSRGRTRKWALHSQLDGETRTGKDGQVAGLRNFQHSPRELPYTFIDLHFLKASS